MPKSHKPLRQVLHLINGESFAGAERVQDQLALRLPAFGYEVTFACLRPGAFEAQRRSDSPLLSFPMRSRWDTGPAFEMARLIKSRGFELVHTHTPRAALVGALLGLLTGKPRVHHVHSPTAQDSARRIQNQVNALVEDLCTRSSLRLLPVSAALVGYLRERAVGPSRITLVPNGVPTPSALKERPAPTGTWIVGCIALFRPRKGIRVLIDACALLLRAGAQVRLHMVGTFESPEHEAEVHAHVRRAGIEKAVHWVGFAKDVQAELARMDLLVLPSLYGEGMPMVLLEAMAAGVPTVASSIDGVREVLDDGRCGALFEAGEPAALVDAMLRLMQQEDVWQTMRAKAHARQVSLYSDVAMARAVAAVYDEVLQ